MRKIIIATVALLVLSGSANAGTYLDAMRTCGAEWKASDARKAVAKGEGMAKWQAFRKECTARVGWESKKRKASAIDTVEFSAARKRK